ncbi:hypothetical protein FRB99_007156 [Tulasnella sp. 403]|nr:hypothetical protein FRB99_007156 [Tulasnella sp. 403]
MSKKDSEVTFDTSIEDFINNNNQDDDEDNSITITNPKATKNPTPAPITSASASVPNSTPQTDLNACQTWQHHPVEHYIGCVWKNISNHEKIQQVALLVLHHTLTTADLKLYKEVVSSPNQKQSQAPNIVSCKWVFCKKKGMKGETLTFKAHLIVKGFLQKEGIDYDETFALVVKLDSEINQMDMKSVFLNSDLKEKIYMEQPEGFHMSRKEDMIWHLSKSLYGLKKASHAQYEKLLTMLKDLKLVHCESNFSVYSFVTSTLMIILLIYVDNMAILSSSHTKLDMLK